MGRKFCARRKTSCPLSSLDCAQVLAQARLPHRSSNPASLRSDEGVSGNWRNLHTTQNQNKNGADKETAGDRLRDLPEWLEDFTENLRDTEVPASANISHDSDSERRVKEASRKHSIYTHFPKDRNCEVCKRTKITRAHCRRRTGGRGDMWVAELEILDVSEIDARRLNAKEVLTPTKR